MVIYLLDNNSTVVSFWKLYFKEVDDVKVICDDFCHFMDTTPVQCVVSPANSYGLMDGGYDAAISKWFGKELMKKVQHFIIENYRGEQPVGTSFIVDTGIKGIKLIHTPTMRVPSRIKEPMVIYQCMRTCMMTAIENAIESIVIPAFGGRCGRVMPQVVCEMMWNAYNQIMNPPKETSWEYAHRWTPERY